jgi:hypothetical protein
MRREFRVRRSARIHAVVGLALLLGWLAAPAYAQEEAFTINDERITESSGLTRDVDQGRYWTVNDSGDDGTAYALSESGEVEGTVNFRADVVDVEAVQYAQSTLYVADIGDNDAERDFVTVYLLNSPQPTDETVLYGAFDLAYPDGPHDAETLLINPDNGETFVVTKGDDAAIYQAPTEPSRDQVNTMTKVADAPPWVTDGTFLEDGRIALRSYVDVKIIDPEQDFEVVAQTGAPLQPQGESVSLDLDGESLLLGSEGEQSAVFSVPIPENVQEAPSPGAEPPSTDAPASPSAAPSQDSDDGGEVPQSSEPGPGRTGTFIALALAAVVSVIAGAGVFLARGR